MNNKGTNSPNVLTMKIIAESSEKSFFPFENEFVEWEKQWIWNQIKSRCNLPTSHRDGLNLISMDFIQWMFARIQHDLNSIGIGCWQVLQVKLNNIKTIHPELSRERKKKWTILKHTMLARFD